MNKLSYKIEELLFKLSVLRINFFYEIYSRIEFLNFIIAMLCEIEVKLKLLFNKEFRENLQTVNVGNAYDDLSDWQRNIPKNTIYCEDCPYKTYSKIAKFFYGSQFDGYCYYLNQGDFTYGNATELLWDGCKECDTFMWSEDE